MFVQLLGTTPGYSATCHQLVACSEGQARRKLFPSSFSMPLTYPLWVGSHLRATFVGLYIFARSPASRRASSERLTAPRRKKGAKLLSRARCSIS